MTEHNPENFVNELAAAIAARMAPAELPVDLEDWARRMGAHGPLWRFQIGDPMQPCYIEVRLNPDGSIRLALLDWYAQERLHWLVRGADLAGRKAAGAT